MRKMDVNLSTNPDGLETISVITSSNFIPGNSPGQTAFTSPCWIAWQPADIKGQEMIT